MVLDAKATDRATVGGEDLGDRTGKLDGGVKERML